MISRLILTLERQDLSRGVINTNWDGRDDGYYLLWQKAKNPIWIQSDSPAVQFYYQLIAAG